MQHEVGKIYRSHSQRLLCLAISASGEHSNIYLCIDEHGVPEIDDEAGDDGERAIYPYYLEPEDKPTPEPFHVGQTVEFIGDFLQYCTGTIKSLNSYQAHVKTRCLSTNKMKVVPCPLDWLTPVEDYDTSLAKYRQSAYCQ